MKKLKISYFTIYLGCLLAVCLLFYVYGYLPISSRTNTLHTQHQTNLAQIARNDSYANNLSKLKEDTAKLTAELAEKKKSSSVSGSAIGDDVYAGLKKASILPTKFALNNVAAVTGSTPSSDGKTLCSVPISLNFSCTALQLSTLLNYYEKSSAGAYYIKDVSYSRDSKNANQLSVTLNMSFYYFGTPPTTTKSSGK